MKKEVFIPFRRFDCEQDAHQFVETLEKMGIVYEMEECAKDANFYFYNQPSEQEFLVKLRQEDFEKADELLLKFTETSDVDLDKNHYLYSFTDEELLEILDNPYEWNEIDRTFAPKLLTNRGYDLSKLDIEGRKEKYVNQLKEGKGQKEAHKWIIVAGYIFAFLGGLLGLGIGWSIISTKTTLPNGEQVYAYTEKSVKHGVRIFILAAVMIIIPIIFLTIVSMLN